MQESVLTRQHGLDSVQFNPFAELNLPAAPRVLLSLKELELIRSKSQTPDRRANTSFLFEPSPSITEGSKKSSTDRLEDHRYVSKTETVKLPVNLTVYPYPHQGELLARFQLNENVFVVGNQEYPYVISHGTIVKMNNRMIQLPEPTAVTGFAVKRADKIVRVNKIPCILPKGTELPLMKKPKTNPNVLLLIDNTDPKVLVSQVNSDLKAA